MYSIRHGAHIVSISNPYLSGSGLRVMICALQVAGFKIQLVSGVRCQVSENSEIKGFRN
jgi:hypothetical protein